MKKWLLFAFVASILLYNCNCGRGSGSADTSTLNQDSLQRADSLKQAHIKDSISNDSILKAQNIVVKPNVIDPNDEIIVEKILEKREEASSLKGKSPEEIYTIYETFIKKYDKNNKDDVEQLKKWSEDPFLNTAKKSSDEWLEKFEKLEDELGKRKK